MSQDLGTPFRQPDLETVDAFIRYCRKHDVITDKKELEYFAKEGLLLPAVRVCVGILRFRNVFAEFEGSDGKVWKYVFEEDLANINYEKLDPKIYYDRGSLLKSVWHEGPQIRGFHWGNDGWLDWYIERGMVKYPAKEEYRPWKEFEGGPSWSTDPSLFDDVSELMYARHQIFPLKFVKNRRSLTIKNEGLFRTTEGWTRAGMQITQIHNDPQSDEWIRSEVANYNRLFGLLVDIRMLLVEKNQHVQKIYAKSVEEGSKEFTYDKEALADAKSADEAYNKKLAGRVEEVRAKHGLSVDDISQWRWKMLNHGTFGTGSRGEMFRKYVTRLDDQLLGETEEAYRIVNQLSWFLELLGEEAITAKQLILRSFDPRCRYCGASFKLTRGNQETCGAKDCKAKKTRDYKKKMRQLNKYDRNGLIKNP